MWKWGITLNYASNSSKVEPSLCLLAAILYSRPSIVQDGRQQNVKLILSLPDTIKYKDIHVGKNYAKNPLKLHKSVASVYH